MILDSFPQAMLAGSAAITLILAAKNHGKEVERHDATYGGLIDAFGAAALIALGGFWTGAPFDVPQIGAAILLLLQVRRALSPPEDARIDAFRLGWMLTAWAVVLWAGGFWGLPQ